MINHPMRLEEKKLVSSYMLKAKVGRPKQMWQLTELAHSRFPDRHAELTIQFIDSVTKLFGESGLEQLISDVEKDVPDANFSAADVLAKSMAKSLSIKSPVTSKNWNTDMKIII